MTTTLVSETVHYLSTFDGKAGSYDPSTQGYWVPCFIHGTKQEDVTLNRPKGRIIAQWSSGFVGHPSRSLDLAQREFCAFLACFPELASKVEIRKMPFSFARHEATRFVTNEPDARILKMAQDLLAKNQGYGCRSWGDIWYWERDAFMKGTGKFA